MRATSIFLNMLSVNKSVVTLKLKAFNFLYLLKLLLLTKKIHPLLISKIFFLPTRQFEMVVLRSPFIYKSSRLKFKFEKKSMVLFFNFLFSKDFNPLLYFFFLNSLQDTYGTLVYRTKAKAVSFNF